MNVTTKESTKKGQLEYDGKMFQIDTNLIGLVSFWLYPLKNTNSSTVALATVRFDACNVIIGKIGLVRYKDRMFLSFPSAKNKKGDYEDVAFICNRDSKKEVEDAIIQAYEYLKEGKNEP